MIQVSGESRLSSTDIVTRSWDKTDTIFTRWNCMCMIDDSTRPLSMFRMKILEEFEPCSMFEDNFPCNPVYDAKSNITSGAGDRRYITANMSDFHQV